jgi:hypothetical protein
VQDNIAVDFGLRGARVNDHTTAEIRAGVTFAFGVTTGPDLLSGHSGTADHPSRFILARGQAGGFAERAAK